MNKTDSIGIFDSGFGGLTVMRVICDLLPYENIVYLADTARLPYGNKSPETILRYCLENIAFLLENKIKALVIACHTACTAALEEIKKKIPIPIIGISEIAIEEISCATRSEKIAVLGTRSTIASGFYQRRIAHLLPAAEIIAISCPLFVPLIEEGYCDHLLATLVMREYFRPIKDKYVDAILLGCTHYPLLQPLMYRELGPEIALVDPAFDCARKTGQLLQEEKLMNITHADPQYVFYVSDDPDKFRLLGASFLRCPIENVHLYQTQ